MAVIQISKIQVRRGKTGQEPMPQLSSGEFGWSIDNRQLFIGGGSVAEGAPAVENVEILTSDRLFDLLGTMSFTATNYTYQGRNPDVAIQTGPGANFPVVRSIQNKLDDSVSLADFGVVARDDITVSLQRALNEINFSTEDNKVPLRIPAGMYFVTATIHVPPQASIVGDGIDKTIIVSLGKGSDSTIFSSSSTNVSIKGLTLSYDEGIAVDNCEPLMIISGADDLKLSEIKFTGYYDFTVPADKKYSAIVFDGAPVIDPTITSVIENCQVENLCYSISSDVDIRDVVIRNNVFKNLWKGIELGTTIEGTTSSFSFSGPTRIDIVGNKFESIAREAIHVGENNLKNNQIHSENNLFSAVGNGVEVGPSSSYPAPDGSSNVGTAIIKFESHGNSSTNDDFERLWNLQIDNTTKSLPIVEGTAQVRLKFTDNRTLTVSTQTQTLFRIPYDGTNNVATSIDIGYTFEKPTLTRKGTLSIVGSSLGVTFRDSYAISGSGSDDLVFSSEIVNTTGLGNPDTLVVQYLNPSTTGTCVFNLSFYR